MTKWRVTGTVKGKRVATPYAWDSKEKAENHAYKMNWQHPGINARVVKDSPRSRNMVEVDRRNRMN